MWPKNGRKRARLLLSPGMHCGNVNDLAVAAARRPGCDSTLPAGCDWLVSLLHIKQSPNYTSGSSPNIGHYSCHQPYQIFFM